ALSEPCMGLSIHTARASAKASFDTRFHHCSSGSLIISTTIEMVHLKVAAFRRWDADGCMDAIFTGSVLRLHQDNLLDITFIHGDGTTTAAKKGGDNIGFSGHKKVKGDKVVAFCDRNCNVIAPFVSAPGNHNESPLLREALPEVMRIA